MIKRKRKVSKIKSDSFAKAVIDSLRGRERGDPDCAAGRQHHSAPSPDEPTFGLN